MTRPVNGVDGKMERKVREGKEEDSFRVGYFV